MPCIIKSLCRNSSQRPGSLVYGNGPTADLIVGPESEARPHQQKQTIIMSTAQSYTKE